MSDKLAVINADKTVEELIRIENQAKKLVESFNALLRSTNNINTQLKKGTPKEYIKALQAIKKANNDIVTSQNQLAGSLTRINTLERQVAQMLSAQSRAIRDVAAATREESRAREASERVTTQEARTRREVASALIAESRARQQSAREARSSSRANEDNISAYKRFAKQVLEAKNKAKDLGAQMIILENEHRDGTISTRSYNSQMRILTRQFTEAQTRALGLSNQIRRLDASVGDHQRNVGNYRSALNGLTVSFRNLIGAFGVTGAIDMFANLIRSSYETIKVLNAQNVALISIFQTQTQVAFQQEYLSELTNRLGLELVSTTAAYSKYSASVKNTALEGEEARKIFEAFAAASAKLGLNAETQTGIFRALEQMVSKGKVSSEELRLQLGDRLPGAFKLFAAAAGVSTRQLSKMLEQGEVISSEILPKAAKKLIETLNIDLSKSTDTVVAAQDRLKNSWTEFLNDTAQNKEILNGLTVGMEGLGEVVNFLLDTLIVKGTDGVSVLGDLIEIIDSLYEATTNIAISLGRMDESTKKTLFSMNQFKNDLKSMNAVVSVITGTIKGLVDVISAFFETMFQDDGWDKFIKRFETADQKLRDLYSSYNKTQDGIIEANKKGLEYNNEASPYVEAWKKAREEKLAFFQLNGKYFSTQTGRNTGKSLDDYIDVGDQLVKKDKVKQDDYSKEEKKKASALTAAQKDYLKDLQANRDLELAINETAFVKGLKNERDYLNTILNIESDYYNKKINYLKGKNAEERKQRADAILDLAKVQKETQKKVFEIDSKQLEENYKKQVTETSRRAKFFENSDFYDTSGRLESEIALNDQRIENAQLYYSNLIDLAEKANQDVLDIERKRDDEVGALQDERTAKIRTRLEAYIEDLNVQSQTINNAKILSIEEQRSLILSNKKINNDEREYALSILEKKNQIELNKLEIKRLQALKSKLSTKEYITQEDERQISEFIAQIKVLENTNIEIDLDISSTLSPAMQKTKDIISQGLNDLGLENLSNQFNAVFQKIVDGTFSAKDAAIMAAGAIGDALLSITDKTKENTIRALDEQLKYTQQTTEQELGFINQRLEQLNNIEVLTAEQYAQRNQLEDEARTLQEQQRQREKLIETQKARAEQKAAAQQALINGAVGASLAIATYPFPASLLPAGLALAFGVAQSVAIMAKDPVPKYRIGRKGGKSEYAITQDGGRELITDKKGNIKNLGSDKGDKLTWLDAGDNVHTAKETKVILKKLMKMPKIGTNVMTAIAQRSMIPPSVVINQKNDNSDVIAEKIGRKFENALKKYDKPAVVKNNGKILLYSGANLGVKIGEYDKNGNEIYYTND